jgi:hypothetical protein
MIKIYRKEVKRKISAYHLKKWRRNGPSGREATNENKLHRFRIFL